MFDLFKRACRHPINYSGICRTTNLKLVEKTDEGGEVFSFVFKSKNLPSWRAGQHAIFKFKRKEIDGKSWRPFSVASAPHEGQIQIGTIISDEPSSFKQHLSSLNMDGEIKMYGPFGELFIRPKMKRVVAVCGGIGITPFRSIIADLTAKRSEVKLTLIYSAKDSHTYKQELDEWVRENKNINITYSHTPEEVNTELQKQVTTHSNNAYYMLSGAPGMIEALRNKLLELGIKKNHIYNDPFKGY